MEDLLFERGIDICHETVRLWWNRFGPLFAGDIRRQRISRMKGFRQWRWHLDEMYVKINGEMVYLWRAVDHEGEILEIYVTKTRDKKAALAFMKRRSSATDHPKRSPRMTAHGFRAMAATLLNEMGVWNPDAIEKQLAHLDASAVRRAYTRGEYWDERVRMMQHWSDHLDELRDAGKILRPDFGAGRGAR